MSKFSEWMKKRKLEKEARQAEINHDSNDESTPALNSNTNENQSKQKDNLTKEQTLNSSNSNQTKIEDEKKEENSTILNRDIKDGILYLTTDDLVDIYLHSSVGADEKVYVPKNYIQKYDLDNDEIKFVNVNGINVPVSQFVTLNSANDDHLLKKQVENSNSIINNNKKSETSDDSEISVIQQLQSENQDTNKSLISKSNPTSIKNESTLLVSPLLDPISDGIASKTPVQLIKSIETNYNVQKVLPIVHEVQLPSADEISIIQQLQSENKNTNQSLLKKEVSNNSLKQNIPILASPILDPVSNGISTKAPIKLIIPSTSSNEIKQVLPVIHETILPSQDEIHTIQELQIENKNTSNSLKTSNLQNLNNNDLSQNPDEISIIQQLQSENKNTNQSLISKTNPTSIKNEPALLVSPILDPISDGIATKKPVQLIKPIETHYNVQKVLPIIHEVQLPSADEISTIQQLQSENKDTNESLLKKEVSNNSLKQNIRVLISPVLDPISERITTKKPVQIIRPINSNSDIKKVVPVIHEVKLPSQDEIHTIQELQTQNKNTSNSLKTSNLQNLNNNDLSQNPDEISVIQQLQSENKNTNQSLISKTNPTSIKNEPALLVSPILDPISDGIATKKPVQLIKPIENHYNIQKVLPIIHEVQLPSADEINTIQQLQSENKSTNQSLLKKEVSNDSLKQNIPILISPILQEPLNEGTFTKKLETKLQQPKSYDIEELSQDEVNKIKQLQIENKNTTLSLNDKNHDFNDSNNNKQVILESPILQPLNDGIVNKTLTNRIQEIKAKKQFIEQLPNDEINTIQQLQLENKNTNESLSNKNNSLNNSSIASKTILSSPIFDPISDGASTKTLKQIINNKNPSIQIQQIKPKSYDIKPLSQDDVNTIQQLQSENKNTSLPLTNESNTYINEKKEIQTILASPITDPISDGIVSKRLINKIEQINLKKHQTQQISQDEVNTIQQLQLQNKNTNESLIKQSETSLNTNNIQPILESPIFDPISNGVSTKTLKQIINNTNPNIQIQQIKPKSYDIKPLSQDEVNIIKELQIQNKNTNEKPVKEVNLIEKNNNNQPVLSSPIFDPISEGNSNKILNAKPKKYTAELISQDEINTIQQLQTQNKDTNESLMNKININKIMTKNQNQNQKILSSPILDPIQASVSNTKPKNVEVKSNNNLPSQDDISTIQQLQAQNKNTNDSLLVKNENQSRINKSQVQEQNQNIPEAYLRSDDEVTKIAKSDPIQKIDDSMLFLQQKYAGQKDYQIKRQNEINKNNVNNLNNKQTINNESLNQKPQFVEVITPAQNYADNKKVCSSPIPQSNDEQYTKDLYQAIKQEQVNQIYNSISSDSAKVITISEPELVQEFNKYKVDPRRKIYIMEEEDALKTFGIVDDNSVDQKVLFEGNVLKVYSGENNQLLSAPYGTIEDNYLNDNVFFLEHNFTVAVDRYIPRTKINMNNFRVEVSYVAFRLPKDKRLIAARNADINEYEARIHDYFKDIGEAINDPQKEGNKTYISLATSHELGLVDNQTKANNDLEKIKVTKDGVNEKINLINIFNNFYSESLKPNRKYDRRIKHFIRMIRQILMDSCYYAESGLLVLNYAEVLLFLDQYYDLDLDNVYDLSTQHSNILLFDTAKYAVKNNLRTIDGYLKVNDSSYFIPLNYDYVLYDSKLLNIVDDLALDMVEVERVLLNRPLFTDNEFFNMDPSNFDRLRAISPYIDFVKYYEQKRIQSMYSNSYLSRISQDNIKQELEQSNHKQNLDEIIKEQKEVVKPYFYKDEAYKHDDSYDKKNIQRKNKIENGVLFLSENELVDLYQHSHVSEDGTLYIDKNEAEKYGLVDEDIKAISVNNQIIPLSSITKSEEINELKKKYQQESITSNLDNSKKSSSTKIEDGIIYLSEKDLVHLYQHSHVTEDGTVYLDKIEADKYGLNNANIKAISVNNQIIPLSSITKQEMDKELADEQEFIKAKEHSKKRRK